MTTKDTDTHSPMPAAEPLALRLSEGLGAGAEAVLTMTAAQLQDRLELARAAAREGAWRELLERFSPRQRQHLANLMAHDWTISAVEIQTCLATGSEPSERIEATKTTEELWPDGIFKPKCKSA